MLFDTKTKAAAVWQMSRLRREKAADMHREHRHSLQHIEDYSHEYSIRGVCKDYGCTREKLLSWCLPGGMVDDR